MMNDERFDQLLDELHNETVPVAEDGRYRARVVDRGGKRRQADVPVDADHERMRGCARDRRSVNPRVWLPSVVTGHRLCRRRSA